MVRMTKWIAFVALSCAASTAGAQEPKKDAATDSAIYDTLRDVINHGADLYNSGDWNGCYRLWEGTLMTLRPTLGRHPDLQKAIDTALTNAKQDPFLYRRAWVLRTVLDQIRSDIKGNAPGDQEKRATFPPRMEKTETKKSTESKKPESKEKTTDTGKTSQNTLWNRLGGEAGVAQLVDDFVNLTTRDPHVDFFRHGTIKLDGAQIEKMKHEMVEQVSEASGGPLRYQGPDMKKIHKDMGITEAQFDAVVTDLKKTLERNKVGASDVKNILDAMAKYRQEVVAPNKTGEKKPV